MGRTYLFATDGTESSDASAEYIEELLAPEETEIHVMKVIDLFDEDKLSEISFTIDSRELQSRHEEKALEEIRPQAERLEEAGFETNVEVLHGNPGQEICRRAEELDVNGIFMGRGEHSQLGEMFYGSVSHHVILRSRKSVIVTPTPDSGE